MDFPPRVSPLVRLILGRDQPYARGRIHMKTLVHILKEYSKELFQVFGHFLFEVEVGRSRNPDPNS